MPAPVISGLINRIVGELQIVVWDGEVPRQNVDGSNVVVEIPADLVFKVYMPEGGLRREWTTEDAYSDTGPIHVQLWAIQRSSVETALSQVEALLAKDWDSIDLGSPYAVYNLQMENWYSGQEEGMRTRTSPLLYRGELHYDLGVHGSVPTR